jgi:hypothetical protein
MEKHKLDMKLKSNVLKMNSKKNKKHLSVKYISSSVRCFNKVTCFRAAWSTEILLKEIAASVCMIFFDRDSILLTIFLMVGGS